VVQQIYNRGANPQYEEEPLNFLTGQ